MHAALSYVSPFDVRKRARRKREQEDEIQDDDVKRELRKGHTLLSYSEEMSQ